MIVLFIGSCVAFGVAGILHFVPADLPDHILRDLYLLIGVVFLLAGLFSLL